MRTANWLAGATIIFCLYGCTMPPLYVYFRNYSAQTVTLNVTLTDKRFYQRLPNLVAFYDTAAKRKNMYGYRQRSELVTWTDTSHFTIAIPPYTVMDVNDVAAGHGRIFGLLLIAVTPTKTDTLINGAGYNGLSDKFSFRGSFSKYKYYYDFE